MCIPPNDGQPEHWFQLLFQIAQEMNNLGYLPDNPQLDGYEFRFRDSCQIWCDTGARRKP